MPASVTHGDEQGKGGPATALAVEAAVVGAAAVRIECRPSGAASRRVRAASEREPVGIECRPSGAASERGERAASRWAHAASGRGERERRARAASRWVRTASVHAASDRQALAASGRGERACGDDSGECGDDSGARPRIREGARIRNQASAAITFQTDQRDLLLTFQIADLLLAFQKTKLINADQRGGATNEGAGTGRGGIEWRGEKNFLVLVESFSIT